MLRRSAATTNSNWRGGNTQQQQQQTQVPQQVAPMVQETTYARTEPMDYYTDSAQQLPQETETQTQITDGANGEAGGKRFPPWKKNRTADGRVIKKKKDPNAINLKLKKYVQPKNAAMCLNELKKVTYITEQEGGGGQPTCVAVEVDGQQFRGYGSSKQLAKQAAAEAALVSFVKPPKSGGSLKEEIDASGTKTENSVEGEEGAKDSTPWVVLASFAMYKLFNDWREGRVGVCGGTPNYGGPAAGANMAQALQQLLASAAPGSANEDNPAASAISAYLGKSMEASGKPPMSKRLKFPGQEDIKSEPKVAIVPKPAKALPANAAGMHPVMLLHQMRPAVVYAQSQSQTPAPVPSEVPANPAAPPAAAPPKTYTVTALIDEHAYAGQGSNIKKAKLELALKANAELFGIVSTWAPTEKMV